MWSSTGELQSVTWSAVSVKVGGAPQVVVKDPGVQFTVCIPDGTIHQ